MIFSKPTKYGAGVEIYGDYQDLNSLRQTILDISDSPALNDGADEFVLGWLTRFDMPMKEREKRAQYHFPACLRQAICISKHYCQYF